MSDTTATEQETHNTVQTEALGSDEAASTTPEEHGSESAIAAETENESATSSEASDGEDFEDDSEGDSEGDSDSDSDSDSAEGGESEGGSKSGRRSRPSLRRLEEEGEVAADYLEELLDIVDLDGDIDIDVENGRASVAIVAEEGSERDLRRLVGSRGEVLEALQELSRLAVQARTGERSRLMLDVAGFRAARRRKLEDIAARVCDDVKKTGEAVRMEPMTAFERKVVHDVVADAGLVSESEGEDPGRRVVVHPAGA